MLLAQPKGLPGDQVEERLSVASGQQALGFREPHRCPETTIQLDDDGPGERITTGIKMLRERIRL